ncbi:MAG TPA: cytochrome c, partial [bacterium]|nr:cytochrome c [bacterium]
AGEPAPNPDAAGEPAQGTGSNEPVTPPGGEEAEDEGNPFYPAPVGPYDDLYTFKWFANGTEFGGYVDRNNAPLADRTYRELFDILREPHGQPGRERDFTTLLSDRERWAVVWYIANQGMDNGQEDWQAIWDQQVQLRKNIYGTHCSICHGAVGRGDGPEGHSFDPKPMNFNQLDWAAGVKPGYPVTDQYLYDIIANGKIKPGAVTEWTGMPWWKDQLRDSDMWGLVDFIRNITFDP